jgi:hypothetical protein
MRKSKVFLAVSGLAFFGWLGWLFYLAIVVKPNPVVVSRSQMIAATHFVVANVTVDPTTKWPAPTVQVVQDLRPKGTPLAGPIRVTNLKEGRMPGQAFPPDWKPDEPYLMALTRVSGDVYELTGQPPAPGEVRDRREAAKPWVYPWNLAEVRRQFDRLVPQ